MSTDHHKSLVQRFYDELWNHGEPQIADQLFSATYVRHDLRPGIAPTGPEGQKQIALLFRAAFPDTHLQVDFMVADGEFVVARWTIHGTHRGKWGAVEPTGRSVEFCGVNIFCFANDKVVELWNHRDDFGLIQQASAPVYAGQPAKPVV